MQHRLRRPALQWAPGGVDDRCGPEALVVAALDVTEYAQGVVGRGVLLDIPRLRDLPWLEPGTAVSRSELETAERARGVRPETGTCSCSGRVSIVVDRNSARGRFLPDGDGKTVPSTVEGSVGQRLRWRRQGIHIAAVGMRACDSLNLEKTAGSLCGQRTLGPPVRCGAPTNPGGQRIAFEAFCRDVAAGAKTTSCIVLRRW